MVDAHALGFSIEQQQRQSTRIVVLPIGKADRPFSSSGQQLVVVVLLLEGVITPRSRNSFDKADLAQHSRRGPAVVVLKGDGRLSQETGKWRAGR